MSSTAQQNNARVATIPSVALTGFDGQLIEVETATQAGLPLLLIVGMGNKAIDEARQRVRSAITHSLLEFPRRKVTVNLAPAELPKDGTHLDLPIALSILVASGQLSAQECAGAVFAGELALDGHLRPVRGAIIIAEAAQKAGFTTVYLPEANVAQARLVAGVTVYGVASLRQLFQHLKGVLRLDTPQASATREEGEEEDSPLLPGAIPPTVAIPPGTITEVSHPLDAIAGQEQAKRALIIAAAGRHNLLLSGPPGVGKTMLAKTLRDLLPPLTASEVVDVTKLHSLRTVTPATVHRTAPYRAPHHSITLTALIGGGLKPRPGEVSLAHKGVLLLDELPEYPRAVLEALRQPLEDQTITLSRLYGSITYPADALVVATMNPCPCGNYGSQEALCTCPPTQLLAYQRKISGPLLDRIDLRLTIQKVHFEHFFDTEMLQQTQHLSGVAAVESARKAQAIRYKRSGFYNAYASLNHIKTVFNISPAARALLKQAAKQFQLTSRGTVRTVRVARTIADLEQSLTIEPHHIAEAAQYRMDPRETQPRAP